MNALDARAQLGEAIRSSFTGALNNLLVVTAIVALVGGALAAALIRRKDFVARDTQPESHEEYSAARGAGR